MAGLNEVALKKASTIKDYIYKPRIMEQIRTVMADAARTDRFMRVFYSSMLLNPEILNCSIPSMLSCMIQSAQIGLEPILSRAALVPYAGESTFQMMVRGFIHLAERSGMIINVKADVIYQNDKYQIISGADDKIIHEPNIEAESYEELGRKLGAYSIFYHKDGRESTRFMRTIDILDVRDKYSRAWKKKGKESPWGKREDEMFKKTVVKNHAKTEPCSDEMDWAVHLDNRVETDGSATGVFLPPMRDGQDYDPAKVQERFEETRQEWEKTPPADTVLVNPTTGEVIGESAPEQLSVKDRVAKEICRAYDIPLSAVEEFARINAKRDNVAIDDYFLKLLEYRNDAVIAIRRWMKAKDDSWKTGPEKAESGQAAPQESPKEAASYYDLYKTKRFAQNPKDGLLGWAKYEYGLEKISKWPEEEKAKLRSTMLKRGYGPDQIPVEMKASPEVAPDAGPPAEEPPVVTDGEGGVEPGSDPAPMGNDDVTRSMKAKVEERIAATETDLNLNFKGFIDVLNGMVDPDGYQDIFEVMRAILAGSERFDDIWMEYERTLTRNGPVE